MKFSGILVVIAVLILSIGTVMAVPPGKTVEFASPKGKVTFDGKIHASKGLKCTNCHTNPKLFEMKKGSDKITMAAMNEGKFCGACHDGTKAFSVKAQTDCVKCHKAEGTGDKAEAKPQMQTPGADTLAKDKSATAESVDKSAATAVATTPVPTASGCESKAIGKNGMPLAGAAKASFLKKCAADAKRSAAASDCEAKAVGKDGKPLASAAKAASIKKCGGDAKGGK